METPHIKTYEMQLKQWLEGSLLLQLSTLKKEKRSQINKPLSLDTGKKRKLNPEISEESRSRRKEIIW